MYSNIEIPVLISFVSCITHLTSILVAYLSKHRYAVSIVIFAGWNIFVEVLTFTAIYLTAMVYESDRSSDDMTLLISTTISLALKPLIYTSIGISQDLRDIKLLNRWRNSILGSIYIIVYTALAIAITGCVRLTNTYVHLLVITSLSSSIMMFNDKKLKRIFATGLLIGFLSKYIMIAFFPSYYNSTFDLHWSVPSAIVSIGNICFSCCCTRGVKSYDLNKKHE